MKKNVILLSLIFIPLAACSKIKTPTFEKFSNSVTYEYFLLTFEDYKFADYLKFEKSSKGKAYYGSEYSTSSYLVDVAINETSGTSETEINFQFDAANKRSTVKEKGESSFTGSGAESDEQRVSKISTSIQYQFDSALESYIYIDTKEKTFKKYDNTNITDNIIYLIDDEYLNFYTALKQYESLTDEAKAQYSFYADGNVLSLVNKVEDSRTTTNSETGEVVQTITSKVESLYQMEISDGKFYFRSKTVSDITTSYADEYSGHLKDEANHSHETNYSSLEINLGDLNIKAIDTSSYVSLDKDPAGGLLA